MTLERHSVCPIDVGFTAWHKIEGGIRALVLQKGHSQKAGERETETCSLSHLQGLGPLGERPCPKHGGKGGV